MSVNLIELVGGALSGAVGEKLASAVGAQGSDLGGGLGAAIPAIIGGLLKSSASPSGAGQILDTLTRGNHDGVLGNLAGALGNSDSAGGLLKAGSALLPMIFGNNANAITDLIGGQRGFNRQSGSNLLGILAPIVLGFITKQLKGSGGLNLSSLTGLLGSQRSVLQAAAPAGLANALGVQSLGDLGGGAVPAAASSNGWIKWLLPIVAIAALLFAVRNCQTKPEAVVQPTPAVEPAPAPVEPVAATDGLIDLELADGNKIRVAADGVEQRLVEFIKDGARPVDKTTWFTFDRLNFATGSANLLEESNAQIANVAAILKAWPAVTLKFGGYTDNTGDATKNLALSQARAEAVAAAVVASDIATERVKGEGYGDQFPVADNATEEGRAKNRRVDVRVSAK